MDTTRITKITSLLVLTVWFIACEPLQRATSDAVVTSEKIEQALESNRFSFVPDQVLPQRGRARMVNSGYELLIKNDTLICYLPYFGRAYGGVGYGSGKGPLDFTSNEFDYSKQKNTKEAWEITIKPNDYNEVRQMFFTLYENGTAQLNVQFANRDPISFNGTIRKIGW